MCAVLGVVALLRLHFGSPSCAALTCPPAAARVHIRGSTLQSSGPPWPGQMPSHPPCAWTTHRGSYPSQTFLWPSDPAANDFLDLSGDFVSLPGPTSRCWPDSHTLAQQSAGHPFLPMDVFHAHLALDSGLGPNTPCPREPDLSHRNSCA